MTWGIGDHFVARLRVCLDGNLMAKLLELAKEVAPEASTVAVRPLTQVRGYISIF
jgi:hypothetical protein